MGALYVIRAYATQGMFGRYHLFASFVMVVPWYFLIAVLKARYTKIRLAIISDGQHPIIMAAPNIDWQTLNAPYLSEPISAIVVDPNMRLTPVWEHFIAEAVLQGTPVYDARHMMEALIRRVEIRHMAENTFGSLLPSLFWMRLKRPIDLITSIPALVLSLPILLIFGMLIKLESPGPAIFTQQRTGYRGKPFTFYKLRSMRIDQEGPFFTVEGDNRVTRIGRFIRKYRIDELPQIFNIVLGDMSWIGPRPEAVELAERYEREIPFYVYRHAVRPGITGWAAVHQGNVADVGAATEKLQYDFFYIKYWSFSLDVLVTVKTVYTVLTGFGSR